MYKMNNGLKKQINTIFESTSNSELKSILNESLNKIKSDYYIDTFGSNYSREMIYELNESISKVELKDLKFEEQEFLNHIKLMNKKEFLKDFNLSKIFSKLQESAEFKNLSPVDQMKISRFSELYKGDNKYSTKIARNVLETLKPYDFLDIVKKTNSSLNYIFENYSKEILLFESINVLEEKNNIVKGLYSKLIKRLENYLCEDTEQNETLLLNSINESQIDSSVSHIFNSLKTVLSNSNKSLNLLAQNENFTVSPVYSFVYETDLGLVFSNGAELFSILNNEVTPLTETQISSISPEYLELCNFVNNSNKFSVVDNTITLQLDAVNKVNIVMETETPKVFVNNVPMEVAKVYPTLLNTFVLDSSKQKLAYMTKVVLEKLSSFATIDFAKNIISKTGDGAYATLFKLNESFSVLLRNWKLNESKFISNVPLINLRNSIFEYMKYDVASSLYEYLGSDFKKIGEIKEQKTEILSTIQKLEESIFKIENNEVKSPELLELKNEIFSNIQSLKEQYSELSILEESFESSEEINSINNLNWVKKK